ncbi:MAG: AAA family ATPase [Bacteroidia bacterium]|nr:AAA family ATPase [Bacteroidia bacterium]
MVDTSNKLAGIMKLIDFGEYFTMNRPRQFGKTTTAFLLLKAFSKREDYLLLDLSFEVVEEDTFDNKQNFALYFARSLQKVLLRLKQAQLSDFIGSQIKDIQGFEELSQLITTLCEKTEKKIVITIDEVDKASNNRLFMQFLALLRDKYLAQNREADKSFHSVVLVGVHDIKNLKRKIRPEDAHSLNSPWNIAVDFSIDLAFSAEEIQTMLRQYAQETQTQMDIPQVAERIFYYTAGYPYLVSKMCKVIDEIIAPGQAEWSLGYVEESFRYLVNPTYTTTLFDDLAKNLNNHPDLKKIAFEIAFNGQRISFNIDNPLIALAHTYGILDHQDGMAKIHNRIFEQRIYNLVISTQETALYQVHVNRGVFEDNQTLMLREAMLSFQNFMRENYSQKDEVFLEREGRLLFLSFLKPVLNGKGFDFKEPVVGNEQRMDIVITFYNQKYILELKRWQGERYHQKGLQQLSDYLDLYHLKEGYLLIYDFRKNKEYKQAQIQFKDKSIFAVWV